MYSGNLPLHYGTDFAAPWGKFDVSPFVDSRCKTPIEEIQAAYGGYLLERTGCKAQIVP